MKVERHFEGSPLASPPGFEPIKDQQWIFDRVVRHYRARPYRCPAHGRAMYRDGGNRCLVGLLIDDAYDPKMEGYRVRDLSRVFVLPEFFRDNIDFLEDLQNLHDDESNWIDGRLDAAMEALAAQRGLGMPT